MYSKQYYFIYNHLYHLMCNSEKLTVGFTLIWHCLAPGCIKALKLLNYNMCPPPLLSQHKILQPKLIALSILLLIDPTGLFRLTCKRVHTIFYLNHSSFLPVIVQISNFKIINNLCKWHKILHMILYMQLYSLGITHVIIKEIVLSITFFIWYNKKNTIYEFYCVTGN